MKLTLDRRRVGPDDSLVDVSIDGTTYSASFATDRLITEKNPTIRRFPLYCWSPSGIFRHGSGPFRYYFQFKTDPKDDVARTLQADFPYSIDFEHDPKDRIFARLADRLWGIHIAIMAYEKITLSDDEVNRYAYDQYIEGNI